MRYLFKSTSYLWLLLLALKIPISTQADDIEKQENKLKTKTEERQKFQNQELITATPFSYIFSPDKPPRIIWRDVDTVRQLGANGKLRVRWFDADLNETVVPAKPGRWGAFIEGTAPNGTPMRRAMTFYCRPPDFLLYFPLDSSTSLTHLAGPISPEVWREHQSEFSKFSKDSLLRVLNDTEAGVILLAGLAGTEPLGRTALDVESAAALNEEYHLALKRKLMGLADTDNPLKPPRKRKKPALTLRKGSMAEAGVRAGTPAKIREICTAWAEDSREPFVTLVARNGVIIYHEANGNDADGLPIGIDYRCDVASITKSVTGILFSQFMDQDLIGLDDSVDTVFPDYPKDNPHVPTFRQCLTHTAGLSGHGSWGGVRHPYLENIILNAIDVNQPGKAYVYTGMGFELTAEAMEIVSGKSTLRLYRDHLFSPLGLGDVPMGGASAGARFTAHELGIFAQWLVNRGSYGDLKFISRKTFEKMLPEPLERRYPGVKVEGDGVEGLGVHWMRHPKAEAKPGADNRMFGGRMLGHGSFSSCIFQVHLEEGLIVTQIRKTAGDRYGEWAQKLFQTIADSMKP